MSQCKFAHNLCILCGQDHRWYAHHGKEQEQQTSIQAESSEKKGSHREAAKRDHPGAERAIGTETSSTDGA